MTKLLTKLFTLPIIFYKRCISPWTHASCRHTPSCSSYALEALETHGILKGLYLSIRRLLRCHPFSKSPHYDPVPAKSTSMDNDKKPNLSNSQK